MVRRYTTSAGRRRLEGRLGEAQRRYDEIVVSNPDAAEAGDTSVWHDNFAYEENQRQMHQWARRVRDLRALLASVEVVAPPNRPESVSIGCAVELAHAEDGTTRQIVIAGYEDGDPANGRVSYTAPLARALLGATPGEWRTALLDGEERELAVLSIERAEEE
jgi:transcription elongation factor GreB